MIKIKKIVSIFLITLVACSFFKLFAIRNRIEYELPEKEKITNQITIKALKKISKKYHLDPIGTGGSMMYDIERLALSFNCQRPLTIMESRELVVKCTLEYLDSINANEKIQPFLKNIPFLPKNIELVIFIYDGNYKNVPNGNISSVGTINGKLTFYTSTPNDDMEILSEETFEEALKILTHSHD